jgi:hypothetical protein
MVAVPVDNWMTQEPSFACLFSFFKAVPILISRPLYSTGMTDVLESVHMSMLGVFSSTYLVKAVLEGVFPFLLK